MSVYLVTWDLNKERSGYAQARANLIARLGQYEHIKDSGLDSVWFLSTDWSASEIDTDLRKHMDSDDRIIVTKLASGEYQGWLDQKIWDWINTRL
jgi:hypothetical protein